MAHVANAHPPIVATNTPVTFGRPRGGAIPAFFAAAHSPYENRKCIYHLCINFYILHVYRIIDQFAGKTYKLLVTIIVHPKGLLVYL